MSGQRLPGGDGWQTANGWCFRRGEHGTVTVWAFPDGPELVVEPTTWAQIVAAVAGISNGYRAALALHEGTIE